MIEINVRFWKYNLADKKGQIKAPLVSGVIRIETNESHRMIPHELIPV